MLTTTKIFLSNRVKTSELDSVINRKRQYIALGIISLLVIIAVSGCGSSSSANENLSTGLAAGSPDNSQVAQSTQPIDPCSLLTKEEVEAEIGPVKSFVPKDDSYYHLKSCVIDSVAEYETHSVGKKSIYEITVETWPTHQDYPNREQLQNESGFGDEAFWAEGGLTIRKGSREIAISLKNDEVETTANPNRPGYDVNDPSLTEKVKNLARQAVDRF